MKPKRKISQKWKITPNNLKKKDAVVESERRNSTILFMIIMINRCWTPFKVFSLKERA